MARQVIIRVLYVPQQIDIKTGLSDLEVEWFSELVDLVWL